MSPTTNRPVEPPFDGSVASIVAECTRALRQGIAGLEKALQWQTFRADDAVKTLDIQNNRIADLEAWCKAAHQFAWAHERTCPRHDADVPCSCGLDAFLSKPRMVIGSFRERIAELEQCIASANSVAQIRYEQIIKNNADATQRIGELNASAERSVGQVKEATEQVERLREQLAAHIRIRDAERAMEAGRIEAAYRRGMERAAEIAKRHEMETLAEVPHPEPFACEHPECMEQRSMSNTARVIAADILAEIAKPAPRCDAECAAEAAKEPK